MTASPTSPRPVILITADYEADPAAPSEAVDVLRRNYCSAILAAGGQPLILPCLPETVEAALALADGLLIAGTRPGRDAHPERRAFETALIREALERRTPILGVCNGMQLLGEVLGGSVDREDPALHAAGSPHIPCEAPIVLAHAVALAPGSRLAAWAGAASVAVNSLHRHALRETGAFRVAARAGDGIVEAIEGLGEGFCLGVQWHPEYRLAPLDERILTELVLAAARARAQAATPRRPALLAQG